MGIFIPLPNKVARRRAKPCPEVSPNFEKAMVIIPTCTNINKKNMRIKNRVPKNITVGRENKGPRMLMKTPLLLIFI